MIILEGRGLKGIIVYSCSYFIVFLCFIGTFQWNNIASDHCVITLGVIPLKAVVLRLIIKLSHTQSDAFIGNSQEKKNVRTNSHPLPNHYAIPSRTSEI